MKGAIFSDHHFGLKKNNGDRLEDAEACVDWIIKECKKSGNLDVCMFLGDLFHNRFDLNVKTIEYAQRSVKKLCKAFKEVYLLVGNHDVYYNGNNELTSTLVLTKKKNLHIIRKKSETIILDGKEILLCPWSTRPKDGEKYDLILGHFEMNGIRQPSGFSSGYGYDAKDISKCSDLIFTGHYHIHEKYEYDKSIIHSVGCAYQHDWSDCDRDKGFYLIDFETLDHKFILNEVSPKFIKLKYSEMLEVVPEDLENTLSGHKNNFLKVEVDGEFVHDKLFEIINKIEKLVTNGVGVEYSDIVMLDNSKMEDFKEELSNKSKSYYMKVFMKGLIKEDKFKNLKIDRLEKLVDVYCNKLEIN